MNNLNFGNALSGAATGAGFGSAFGPYGTAIGGLLGGLGGLTGFGQTKDEQFQQRSALGPEQQQVLSPLYQGLGGANTQGLSALQQLLGYQPESLEAMQAPIMEDFQQSVLPSILERFAGLGAGSSSALNQTLGEAVKGLGTNLGALRAQALQNAAGIRQNALQSLLGYNQFAANPGLTQTYVQGSQPGLFQQLAPFAGQVFGQSQLGQNILQKLLPQTFPGVAK